jgi:hypothetical protein
VLRKFRGTKHVARIKEMRNAYKISVEKCEATLLRDLDMLTWIWNELRTGSKRPAIS